MSRVRDTLHRRVQRGTHHCPNTAHPPSRARLHRRWHTHRPPTYITLHASAKADDIIATITKLMSLPPLTAPTKFLLLSRSLQRRLTHFSRGCSIDAIRVPFSKLQAAVEEAAFNLFQIPQDPHDDL